MIAAVGQFKARCNILRSYGYDKGVGVLIGVWAFVAFVGLVAVIAVEIAQFRNAGGTFVDLPGTFISRQVSADDVGFDISDSAIERLIDRIATERAARLVAEDRADAAEAQLQVVREENERLRLLQMGQ